MVTGLALQQSDLNEPLERGNAELLWLFGPQAVADVARPRPTARVSAAFPDGGFFVMRGGGDHVFIDCGPIGLGGRGGHGHNDCLAFEAALDGVPLVTDCGAFVYTGSVEWRNYFRSTAQHNTPQIEGEEINRLIRADYLWNMRYDARPKLRLWRPGRERDVFVGAHHGYRRLDPAVTPVRTIVLDKIKHALIVEDRFEGGAAHHVRIPFHLSPGVTVTPEAPASWRLSAGGREFLAIVDGEGWSADIASAWVSPSYGIKTPTSVLVFSARQLQPLRVALMPSASVPANPAAWLREIVTV